MRIPTHQPPPHPGEILLEYLPGGMTQVEFARRLGVPFQRLNTILKGRRGITPNTALRLAQVLGTSASFWLNLQQVWDLFHTLHGPNGQQYQQLRPITKGT